VADPDHEHLDTVAQALLAEILDVARATAEARADAGELEPFALVHAGGEERLILLGDVAQHLVDAAGTGRVATTLISRYDAEVFAIVARATASPDGSPQHPQARDVVRVIVGHRDGASGSTWCELRDTADGPRLTGLWETAE
jgi:hypothetical protein